MSTGYGWEGLRQVFAMLLGLHYVLERSWGGIVYLGRYNKCWALSLGFYLPHVWFCRSVFLHWLS